MRKPTAAAIALIASLSATIMLNQHLKIQHLTDSIKGLQVKVVDLHETNDRLMETQNQLKGVIEKLAVENDEQKQLIDTLEGEKNAAKEETARQQAEVRKLTETIHAKDAELERLRRLKAERAAAAAAAQKQQQEEAPKPAPAAQQVAATPSTGKVLTGFEVTWYRGDTATATGATPTDGVTAAVTPSIIPYGSRLKITFPDGRVLYRVAQDTGSAVQSRNGGRVIDIFINASEERVNQLGRSTGVTVEILQ